MTGTVEAGEGGVCERVVCESEVVSGENVGNAAGRRRKAMKGTIGGTGKHNRTIKYMQKAHLGAVGGVVRGLRWVERPEMVSVRLGCGASEDEKQEIEG